MFTFLLLALFSYMLGSVPFGVIVAKRYGLNLFEVGSGNIGATNVERALGKKAGRIVKILDISKGVLPIFSAWLLGFQAWQGATFGILAVVGHIFPFSLGFKGGKGVATSVGVLLGLSLFEVKFLVIVFLEWLVSMLMKKIFGYVSLASITVALILPILVLLFRLPLFYFGFSVFLALLVILRHFDNIKRLLAGNENKIGR